MTRISTMTFTFTEHPGMYRLEELPEIAAGAGVHGLNWVGTYGKAPAELRRLTLDAGLEVTCYTFVLQSFAHGASERDAINEAEARFAESAELGAPRVMIVPLPIDGIADRKEARRRWCSLLPQLSPLARAAGTILTIENYEGTASPFVTAAELLEAAAVEPKLRFTFDIGNAATGENPVECARRLAGTIEYVHLKDWRIFPDAGPGRIPGLTGKYYAESPVGEGDVDLLGTLTVLAEQKYSGFADIEYVGNKYLPHEAVRRTVDWLRSTKLAE